MWSDIVVPVDILLCHFVQLLNTFKCISIIKATLKSIIESFHGGCGQKVRNKSGIKITSSPMNQMLEKLLIEKPLQI